MIQQAASKWLNTLAASLLVLTASSIAVAADNPSPPNIVFIFADDWGWGDLSCHGHPYVKTPNIDRLAAEGTDFHRFTVASGVCSPSRTAVMTGHFPARYNIDGHFAWVPSNAKRNMPDWLSPQAPLLPRFLQQGGYATAHFGKWHLSNNMIPDSPLPSEYGYDTYGAFNCAGEQMPVHEDARNAVAFIEECQREGKPFFINLWLHEPHTPFHTVPKYRWRFRDLDERDNIYASVLSHADDRIGEVLDALDRWNLAANTLVIFSSDNGPARAAGPTELELMHDTATGAGYGIGASRGVTGGRKGYKGALFEGGIGVPFIARWPGKIAAGSVDDTSLISAVDLLPTFCELGWREVTRILFAGWAQPGGSADGQGKRQTRETAFLENELRLAGQRVPAAPLGFLRHRRPKLEASHQQRFQLRRTLRYRGGPLRENKSEGKGAGSGRAVAQEAGRLENNTSEQTDRERILGGKIAVMREQADCCSVVPTESTEFSVGTTEQQSARM